MKELDISIEKEICLKIGKVSLEEADLSKIEELNLSNREFSGKEKNINLSGIKRFVNLKKLSLQYFLINDDIIQILNSLESLQELQLVSCEFKGRDSLKITTLNSLLLGYCKIDKYERIYSPKVLRIIGDSNIKINRINGKQNTRQMYLNESKIKGFSSIKDYTNLKVLNLDGSSVDEQRTLEQIEEKIEISYKEKYLPIK